MLVYAEFDRLRFLHDIVLKKILVSCMYNISVNVAIIVDNEVESASYLRRQSEMIKTSKN